MNNSTTLCPQVDHSNPACGVPKNTTDVIIEVALKVRNRNTISPFKKFSCLRKLVLVKYDHKFKCHWLLWQLPQGHTAQIVAAFYIMLAVYAIVTNLLELLVIGRLKKNISSVFIARWFYRFLHFNSHTRLIKFKHFCRSFSKTLIPSALLWLIF